MSISKTAFDGAAAWEALSPEMQAEVGALALQAAAGSWIADSAYGDEPVTRAAAESFHAAAHGIEALFVAGQIPCRDADGAWQIPAIIGQVCHRCGCSHEDPCEEGCGWASETLCTACEEAAAPAPKIAKAEAAAVRKVVCKALHESPVADPRTLPPMGAELRDLARRIGDMNEEEAAGG